MFLCLRDKESLLAELQVMSIPNDSGSVETLRIGVYNMSRDEQTMVKLLGVGNEFPTQPLNQEAIPTQEKVLPLKQQNLLIWWLG